MSIVFEQNDVFGNSLDQFINVLNSFQVLIDVNEASNETVLKIVKTLNGFRGPFLYHPTILNHGLFAKLRVCYRLLLKARRKSDHSSNESVQCEALSELGAFLCRLSIGISDANVHIAEQLFFNKSFIDELIDDLNVIMNGQEDPLLLSAITSMVYVFSRLQIKDDPMHEPFLDSIVQYLCSIDLKKEMIRSNVAVDHRPLIKSCLHYLVEFKGQRQHYLNLTVCRSQLRSFIEWIQEQTGSLDDHWTSESVMIIDYMATIISTCLANHLFTGEELEIFSSLFETFINILLSSKDSENYFLTSVMIKYLYTFSTNNCLCRNSLPESVILLLSELIDDSAMAVDDDDDMMLNACRLLMTVCSFDKINARKMTLILINSLSKTMAKNKSTEVYEILNIFKCKCQMAKLLFVRNPFDFHF